MEGCEHTEGSPVGKCAICERMVCSECFRSIFTEMICDMHQGLEDEAEWALVGFCSDHDTLGDSRYRLEDHGITSLAVESDEDNIELYVPVDDKEDAHATLGGGDGMVFCAECSVHYTTDMGACPLCGAEPEEGGGMDADSDDVE